MNGQLRRLIAPAITLAAGAIMAGYSPAAEQPPQPQPGQPQPTQPQQPQPQPGPAQPTSALVQAGQLQGRIKQVAENHIEAEVTFLLRPMTQFIVDGRKVTSTEMKPGVMVTVQYMVQNDRPVASVIRTETGTAVFGQPAPGAGGPAPTSTPPQGQPMPPTGQPAGQQPTPTNLNQQPNINRQTENRPAAQPANQAVRGRLDRIGNNQVELAVTVFFGPNVRIVADNKPIQPSDLKVGALVAFRPAAEGDRVMANNIAIVAGSATTPIVASGEAALDQLTGMVERKTPNQIVVRVAGNTDVSVTVNRETRYLSKYGSGQFADVVHGAHVTVAYINEGDQKLARTVTVTSPPAAEGAPVAASPSTAAPAAAAPTKQPESGTQIAFGRMARREGAAHQFVIHTTSGTDMQFVTDAATTYQFRQHVGRFSDYQAGDPVWVEYVKDGDRNVARHVGGVTWVEGRIVKTVGSQQVVMTDANGQQVILAVTPETKYQLSAQGGTFADLRPGAKVGVFYSEGKPVNQVRQIYTPMPAPPSRPPR